jgi:hypothetical protein
MNRITLAPTTLPNTPPLEFIEAAVSAGYEGLGATYALVIGRDDDWSRQRDNFGRFCDVAAGDGLTAAIEAPVGTLSPISAVATS